MYTHFFHLFCYFFRVCVCALLFVSYLLNVCSLCSFLVTFAQNLRCTRWITTLYGCLLRALASATRSHFTLSFGGWILMKLEIKQIHRNGRARANIARFLVSGFTVSQYILLLYLGFYSFSPRCGCLNVNSCSSAVTNDEDVDDVALPPYRRCCCCGRENMLSLWRPLK